MSTTATAVELAQGTPLPAPDVPLLRLSEHAWARLCARSLNLNAVRAALDWGRYQRAGNGCTRWRLDRKSVAYAARQGVDLRPHEGVTVVTGGDGSVVTVWRHRKGLPWKRKPGRRRR